VERDLSLVIWIADQCYGLAKGLKQIHRSNSTDKQQNITSWGIHGDLKPKNILWFASNQQSKHGSLVICDYGFTRFHSKETRSLAKLLGISRTYRAPEADLGKTISAAYDYWTLGCVYLEFITWYLTGFRGVEEEFPEERENGDQGSAALEDKFFNIIEDTSGRSMTGRRAVTKPAVLDVSLHRLRLPPLTSDVFDSGSSASEAMIDAVCFFMNSWT
jgi:serine/threonine protein kinase